MPKPPFQLAPSFLIPCWAVVPTELLLPTLLEVSAKDWGPNGFSASSHLQPFLLGLWSLGQVTVQGRHRALQSVQVSPDWAWKLQVWMAPRVHMNLNRLGMPCTFRPWSTMCAHGSSGIVGGLHSLVSWVATHQRGEGRPPILTQESSLLPSPEEVPPSLAFVSHLLRIAGSDKGLPCTEPEQQPRLVFLRGLSGDGRRYQVQQLITGSRLQ